MQVEDVQLPGQDKDKKKAAKASKEAGAIVEAGEGGRMFAMLVDQRPGIGCEVRMINPPYEEHIWIEDDNKMKAIPPRKLLDSFVCKYCRKADRENQYAILSILPPLLA